MTLTTPIVRSTRREAVLSGAGSIEIAVAPYPALLWLARRGNWIVAAVVIVNLTAVVVAWWLAQPLWVATWIVGAIVFSFLTRLLVEIVRLLADTLIPHG